MKKHIPYGALAVLVAAIFTLLMVADYGSTPQIASNVTLTASVKHKPTPKPKATKLQSVTLLSTSGSGTNLDASLNFTPSKHYRVQYTFACTDSNGFDLQVVDKHDGAVEGGPHVDISKKSGAGAAQGTNSTGEKNLHLYVVGQCKWTASVVDLVTNPATAMIPTPTPAPTPKPTPKPKAPQVVVFTCTGTDDGDGISITYGPNGTDLAGPASIDGTWSTTLPLDNSKEYYALNAQLQGAGDVTCTVKGGGATSTGEASGGYNIASPEIVSGFLGWQST